MSVETKSLRRHDHFYGTESLTLDPAIEGMLQFAGLKKFIEKSKTLLGESNPILSQAYLLFIYYKKQILDLHTESLNNLAASKLVEKFGIAGIGIDQETGEVDDEITDSIIETHDELATNVIESSAELQNSISRFAVFFATIQTAIMELVTKYQEDELEKLEAETTEEKKLKVHLDSKSKRNSGVVYDSAAVSKKAQENRGKKRNGKKTNILNSLGNLASIAIRMFTPTEQGTREMRSMAMAA